MVGYLGFYFVSPDFDYGGAYGVVPVGVVSVDYGGSVGSDSSPDTRSIDYTCHVFPSGSIEYRYNFYVDYSCGWKFSANRDYDYYDYAYFVEPGGDVVSLHISYSYGINSPGTSDSGDSYYTESDGNVNILNGWGNYVTDSYGLSEYECCWCSIWWYSI